MRKLMSQSGMFVIFLALVLATTNALGQQGAHATVLTQAHREAALAFQLADISGTNKQMTDYRGKVVLLNFWATACG